jgi:hypothetical protein
MATTGPTHQFKVNKMPEELLFQPFPSLNSRQCFRKMEPYEFKFSKSLLSDKISAMRRIFEKSITDHGREADKSELLKQFERLAVDCIRNNCSSDFLNDYGREMANFEKEEDCFNFLESVFGSETEEERRARAVENLEELTSSPNEKFSSLLSRIKSIATVISDKPDAQNFIIEQNFSRNIEPSNKTFLRDHGYGRKPTEEIVDFLDQRERYLSVNISALQTNDFAAYFADKTSEMLDNKFAQMELNHEKKTCELTETIKSLNLTVARLEAENKKRERKANESQFERPQGFQAQQPAFHPQQPAFNSFFGGQQQSGGLSQRAPFCYECRTPGHFKSVCPRIQCYECKSLGHIGRNCPKRQSQQPPAPKN